MTTKRPTTDLTSWPEGALRGLSRVGDTPCVRNAALAELGRRTFKPWLSGAEKIIAIVNLLAVLGLISIAFWLSACTFPSEGTGPVACADCYRPPHPGPYPSSKPNDIGPSTDESNSSGAGESLTDEGSSTSDDGTTVVASTEESSSSESSSTGETAPFEPAHCDMTCPAGDALEPSPEQAVGGWQGCYCATPCESDDECAPFEHCEPFFDRCTISCNTGPDCYLMLIPEDPEAVVDCILWWNDADHYARFCGYPYEDAP